MISFFVVIRNPLVFEFERYVKIIKNDIIEDGDGYTVGSSSFSDFIYIYNVYMMNINDSSLFHNNLAITVHRRIVFGT